MQETGNPVANGEKQHIVLTAGPRSDGSKYSGEFHEEVLSLKWSDDDVVEVMGALEGQLTAIHIDQDDPSYATFEGNVSRVEDSWFGNQVVFGCGGKPFILQGQDGTKSGMEELISTTGVSAITDFDPSGNYQLTLELPVAVLKLDVSEIVTEGKLYLMEREVSHGEVYAFSFTDVTITPDNCEELYFALNPVAPEPFPGPVGPVKGSGFIFQFRDSDGNVIGEVTKNWNLQYGVFYTARDEQGHASGKSIKLSSSELEDPTLVEFTQFEYGYETNYQLRMKLDFHSKYEVIDAGFESMWYYSESYSELKEFSSDDFSYNSNTGNGDASYSSEEGWYPAVERIEYVGYIKYVDEEGAIIKQYTE